MKKIKKEDAPKPVIGNPFITLGDIKGVEGIEYLDATFYSKRGFDSYINMPYYIIKDNFLIILANAHIPTNSELKMSARFDNLDVKKMPKGGVLEIDLPDDMIVLLAAREYNTYSWRGSLNVFPVDDIYPYTFVSFKNDDEYCHIEEGRFSISCDSLSVENMAKLKEIF